METYRNKDGILIMEGNFGACRFCSNMDEKYGLPSLLDNEYDLCLTDPPYNVKFKRKDNNYNDSIDNYEQYCKEWFEICQSKSRILVFTPGIPNEWYYPKPTWEMCWFKPGSTTHTTLGGFNFWQPILVYMKEKKMIRLPDSIRLPDCVNHRKKSVHPSPKPDKLWMWLAEMFNPNSILDPYLGSGTSALVAETLGIPWIGFELLEQYSPDIEERIQKGMRDHSIRQNTPKIKPTNQLKLEI